MTAMGERVAKAIAGRSFWTQMPETGRNELRKEASAVLAAMREPTPEMVEAGRILVRDCRHVWQTMIDAAIAEK